MRTFIAVELPASIRGLVQTIQEQIQDQLHCEQMTDYFKWAPVENLHITLRFFGETSPIQRAAIANGLEQIANRHKAFSLHLGRLGAFPSLHRPNVLWLGVHGDLLSLGALQTACEQMAGDIGFAREQRPFSAHLTLARVIRNIDHRSLTVLGDALIKLEQLSKILFLANLSEHSTFVVNQIVYMQSKLSPAGATYTPIQYFSLLG